MDFPHIGQNVGPDIRGVVSSYRWRDVDVAESPVSVSQDAHSANRRQHDIDEILVDYFHDLVVEFGHRSVRHGPRLTARACNAPRHVSISSVSEDELPAIDVCP